MQRQRNPASLATKCHLFRAIAAMLRRHGDRERTRSGKHSTARNLAGCPAMDRRASSGLAMTAVEGRRVDRAQRRPPPPPPRPKCWWLSNLPGEERSAANGWGERCTSLRSVHPTLGHIGTACCAPRPGPRANRRPAHPAVGRGRVALFGDTPRTL